VAPPSISATAVAAVAAATDGTQATGARGASGWSRTVRTVKITKVSDTGSGVSRAQISVNGGVSYLTRNKVTVRNGDVKIYCRAIDRKGNRSQAKYLGHFKIDTTRPTPAALGASVKRGSTASLRYRIADYSPCVVRIAVKNSRGVTVKSITVRGARPMSWLKAGFRCTLAKGTYRFSVTATDSVGYTSVKAAGGKLVVKKAKRAARPAARRAAPPVGKDTWLRRPWSRRSWRSPAPRARSPWARTSRRPSAWPRGATGSP
jgi:hypothetical protein